MILDPTELRGDLCVVSTFFNPLGLPSKSVNFRKYRDSMRRQGARLAVIECVFDGMTPELSDKDCDFYYRVHGGDVLWQKERLLNIAIKRLPAVFDKVVICDADVLFCDDQWVERASRMLEHYRVIQPYSYFVRLPKDLVAIDFATCKLGTDEGKKFFSFALGYNLHKTVHVNLQFMGSPGFSWGFRRSLIEQLQFFDCMIVGGADTLMAYAFVSPDFQHPRSTSITEMFHLKYRAWQKRAFELTKGSVGVVTGNILHLWHGMDAHRHYVKRHEILTAENFDPNLDIQCEDLGPWYWNSNKPNLHRKVSEYFPSRREDH